MAAETDTHAHADADGESESLTLVQAVRDGLHTEMERDDDVVVMGEDVGKNGGVFRATEGLYDEFGENRVIDTPLAESGIVGTAIGMAAYGMRPVPEMQFLGFIYPAFDQIVSHAARLRTRSRGRYTCPMVTADFKIGSPVWISERPTAAASEPPNTTPSRRRRCSSTSPD